MLDATELAQLRADVAAVLDFTCTIQRQSTSKSALGQETGSWNTIATVQAAVSQPSASMLQNYNYRIESLAAWHVQLPYGTDIQPEDHLLITGQASQQTLEVQVLLEPRSYAALLSVIASELKP